MSTALVTGAGGFLGRAVVRRLEALGVRVARLAVEPSLSAARLAPRIEPVEPDYVLNLAAPPPGDPPERHARVTQAFGLALFEAVALAAPAARIVTIGSAAEFGALTREDRPMREDDPCAPVSAYGQAKHAITQAVGRLNGEGRDISVLRLFTAAGPGAPPHTVLGAAARQLNALPEAGGDVVLGPLDAWRDYLLVDEAARLITGLVQRPGPLPALVHMASGRALSVAAIIAAMIDLAGKPCRLVQADAASHHAGPSRVVGDVARLRGLGFQPWAPEVGEVARAVLTG